MAVKTEKTESKSDEMKQSIDDAKTFDSMVGGATSPEAENEKLKQRIVELEEELAVQGGFEPIASTPATRNIRTEMLITLLPVVGIEHPRSMAQKAAAAVDVIMETWGME